MAACLFERVVVMAKSIIYVDGFNLYYGVVRGTPHKWLDLERLFVRLRQSDEVQKIKYFTARVREGQKRQRQENYLRALATRPLIEIIEGKFKLKEVACTHPSCTYRGRRIFKCPEEKRTDVNIALHLLDDASEGLCDTQVIVSGDSDLVPAVEMVKLRYPTQRVIVYVPARDKVRGAATELRSIADRDRTLPRELVGRSQLPAEVRTSGGTVIRRPEHW